MLWKPVLGFEGIYSVSYTGYVRRHYKSHVRILAQVFDDRGYQVIGLVFNKQGRREYVHRLVAQAFVENPENLPCVNHKDCNKSNNHFSNLEWVTSRGNYLAAVEAGRSLQSPQVVFQVDPKTNLVIKRFESHSEAARLVGCDQGNISQAVRLGWLHFGYRWVSDDSVLSAD